MKKICAFCLTAFYLLLASGGYECVLHCTAEYLFTDKIEVFVSKDTDTNNKKGEATEDDDKCGADCTCCYHHGTYVVRENINAVVGFQLSAIHISLVPFVADKVYFIPQIVNNSISWPRATGPPFISGTAIYLANQTFLI
ncbi:hypothetical protein [Mucilaginibacter sp. UYCu711]|uniref:hypothetical protein n=1 Tax=Mucilaginibacter sp. UYCu711 TaxID=3156339 RepID=UPI0032682AF0